MVTQQTNRILPKILALTCVSIFFLLFATLAHAQATPGDGTFVPLSNVPFLDANTTLSGLLNTLFTLTIGIAAALSVIMIAIGGFQYMGSEAYSSKQAAKEKIMGAFIGIAIILGSVLLLSTINPNLLNLNPLSSAPVPPQNQSGNLGSSIDSTYGCSAVAGSGSCCNAGDSSLLLNTDASGVSNYRCTYSL